MRAPTPLARLLFAVVALAALAMPAGAGAYYGNTAEEVAGAQLVSADYARLEQGDDTTRFAAISSDGRYVAIETLARNFFADDDPDPAGEYRAGGIFRFDLQTRTLAKVADGNLFRESDGAFLRWGASNPSSSADGRYIAFSTGEQLVPSDVNDNIDAYVRDMSKPAGDPGAYTLVSARNGGNVPASYGPPPFPTPASDPGAEISAGVAISADGTKVVFRTEAASDLPDRPAIETPSGQVFVRDLATQTTTLVTSTRDAGTGLMNSEPAGGAFGAALSADGTTVAWTGHNAASQTRFLAGENTDPSFNYYLWRRAPFGPVEPTRRITGLSDPDDPTCRQMEVENPGMTTVFDPSSTGPCFGPLVDQEGNRSDITAHLPALSGDGYTVAFLSGAGTRPAIAGGAGLDLYVTDMRPGVSRKQGTVELTRDTSSGDIATSAPLGSVAISSDGRYLAITTSRTKFLLPALQLTGSARAVPGPRELYVVDLKNRTLERATRSLTGGDVDGGVQDGVTISGDGSRLAFSSFAGNLFRGDANQRADAFVATRLAEPGEGTPGGGGGGAGSSFVTVDRAGPRLFLKAKAKAKGVVVLTVSVPSAGTVNAIATARTGNPPSRQVIATRKTRARGKGSFHLVIRAAPRFRSQLREHKLHALLRVTFTPAAGGRRLHASTDVAFSG